MIADNSVVIADYSVAGLPFQGVTAAMVTVMGKIVAERHVIG
jgi:hypothetical protein